MCRRVGRVVQHRGGGQPALLDRLFVEEGLQRGAGLARRDDGVHRRGLRQVAAGADPCEHVAGGVVQHHHRAVLHVAVAQLGQLLAQRVAGAALRAGVQRRAQRGRRRRLRRSPSAPGARSAARADRPDRPTRVAARPSISSAKPCAVAHASARPCAFSTPQARWPTTAGAALGARSSAAAMADSSRVEPRRRLLEQRLRHRRHAHLLAAERHQVEPGLEDLVLAPGALDAQRGGGLLDLRAHRTAAPGSTRDRDRAGPPAAS